MILNPRKYKEFNEAFAEYLGCTKGEDDRWYFPDGSKMTKTMRFHDKWDWLMMVVEKICNDRPYTLMLQTNMLNEPYLHVCLLPESGEGLKIFASKKEETLILNVYNVCYQYIKSINNGNNQ